MTAPTYSAARDGDEGVAMARATSAAWFAMAVAAGLRAQGKDWSADEASVPALLRALAPAPKSGPGIFIKGLATAPLQVVEVRQARTDPVAVSVQFLGTGYRFRLYSSTDRDGAGEGFVLYAWPASFGGDSTRAFALSHHGTVMWSDNASTRYGEAAAPEWTAVVGRGSKGIFADALTMPGKGMDEQMWRTLAMERPQKGTVRLRSTMANDATIKIGPLPWFRSDSTAVPVPFPAGVLKVDDGGRAVCEGLPRSDYRITVAIEGRQEVAPQVQFRDGVLELTIDDAAIFTARANANESAAIATLKNISSAQAQCQASCAIDSDRDGRGEYGFFGELSGAQPVRADAVGGVSDRLIAPPVLSAAFGRVADGRVQRSGYLFQMFLLDAKGNWTAENKTGGSAGVSIDANLAEVRWCVCAWPTSAGQSGRRAFFVNEGGDVLATGNAEGKYSGPTQPMPPTAAFTTARCDQLAANTNGNDGARWMVVN